MKSPTLEIVKNQPSTTGKIPNLATFYRTRGSLDLFRKQRNSSSWDDPNTALPPREEELKNVRLFARV
jgi:hypothetical protein